MDTLQHTPPVRRSFWQRRVRDPLVAQLTQGITPHKLALTIAVGCACALFPVLGTTTLLCFLIAVLLRLNQPIIQLLNQALWPVHVPVIFACVRLGEAIWQAPHASFNLKRMHRLFWDSPLLFFREYGSTAAHAVTAWAVVAPFFIALLYFTLLPVFREVKRLKTEATKSLD